MAYAEAGGARLWYEEAGEGRPVVLAHSSLVDSRQWDGQVEAFAARYRTIRYDLRYYGRSDRTGDEFSEADDLAGLLDHLGVQAGAIVASSYGGRVGLDFALAYPGRVEALVLVCSGFGGYRFNAYTAEQEAEFEAAVESGDLLRAADIDLEVWAPLGAEGRLRELTHANAHANAVEASNRQLDPPALGRLGEIRAPTLVITGNHDVPAMEEIGDLLEAGIPGARRVRFEHSDHFPNLREPERFNQVVLDFLAAAISDTPGV